MNSSTTVSSSISPAEFSTHYGGGCHESIKTHELHHYSHAYVIILLILFVIIIIILAAIAISVSNIVSDLQKRVLIPINDRLDSAESRLASIEARTGEMADRVRGWDGAITEVVDMGELADFEPPSPPRSRRSRRKC